MYDQEYVMNNYLQNVGGCLGLWTRNSRLNWGAVDLGVGIFGLFNIA